MDDDTTVILANGTFPTAFQPLEILRHAKRIVCCDGAVLPCVAAGFEPTVVIGDLDSFPAELRERHADKIVHVAEQETNDLNKAFRYCMAQGWREIVILGATGKREDHTLGNISLLADFAAVVPGIRMVTDDGEFTAMSASGRLESKPGQQISLFSLDAATAIHSDGLKYPLDGLTPVRWWQATLNEAVGTHFELSFPPGHTLLIYRVFC